MATNFPVLDPATAASTITPPPTPGAKTNEEVSIEDPPEGKGTSNTDAFIALANFLAQRRQKTTPNLNLTGIGRPAPIGPLASSLPLGAVLGR